MKKRKRKNPIRRARKKLSRYRSTRKPKRIRIALKKRKNPNKIVDYGLEDDVG